MFRVRKSRTSSRLYAEKVVVYDHDGEKPVSFAYNAKAMAWLRRTAKLTWLEARDFGAAYGACVACGRTLSDPRSLVQQYGSTCAGHYGWPTVSKKQAEAIIEGVVTWDEVIAGIVARRRTAHDKPTPAARTGPSHPRRPDAPLEF